MAHLGPLRDFLPQKSRKGQVEIIQGAERHREETERDTGVGGGGGLKEREEMGVSGKDGAQNSK